MRLPARELLQHMSDAGVSLRQGKTATHWSIGPLLETLLYPFLRIDVALFDSEMPGFSGSASIAVLTLGQTREVRRRLLIASAFIAAWSASSGLSARVDDADRRRRAEWLLRDEQKEREAAELIVQTAERTRAAEQTATDWESGLHAEVLRAVGEAGNAVYCRLNFLVHEGVVFFLQRGWWHALPGNPHNVAAALESDGVAVVRLAVTRTSAGYIPGLARRHAETPGVGWGECSLEVEAPPSELATTLARARSLLRQ